MPQKRYIIIGDGAAGTTAAQALRAANPTATIAILSDDPHAAYFRAALTNYLLGELREEQIWAVPPSFYDENTIHRALVRVAQVDTKRSLVWLGQGGRPIPYDALVLASGARARPPSFEGHWLPGVMTMRTLSDVRGVMDLIKLKGLRSAVVVGGGPLALEWAHGLSHRGVKVMLVVRDQRFLPTAIDSVSSDLLLARLRHAGVEVRMGDEVMAAAPGPQGRVQGVILKSGERVGCELVAVAIGVVCNTEFLADSGVKLAKNGGIEVDDRMRTSVENVYAAGDCATFGGRPLQLWEPARMMARVAASTISGKADRYTPGAHYMATRLYDLDCATLGAVAQPPPGAEELVDFPQRTGRISYRKLIVHEGRLVGALMFGEREAHVRRFGRGLKRLIDAKTDINPIRGEILDPAFDLTAWLQTNAIKEKPRYSTLASEAKGSSPPAGAKIAKMKGTHAINLADLPPLPPVGAPIQRKGPGSDGAAPADPTPGARGGSDDADRKAAAVMQAKLDDKGTAAMLGFADLLPAPRVRLEGPPGQIDVMPPSAIIGRHPQSPIPLHDPAVSYTHAEITIEGQLVYVRDLGSTTGTWVNGAPVTAPKRVRDGDKIRVGATELTVRIQSADGSRASLGSPSLPKGAQQGSGEPKPHLDVKTGRSIGLSFELVQSPTTIGRDPRCTIRLDDEWIDLQHAWLRQGPQGWEVADAESHGVTRKNGQVLTPNQWVPLAPGDTIQVGEVQMTFSVRHSDVLVNLLAPASVSYTSAATPQGPPPRARLSVRQGPGQGSVAELADVTVIGNQPGQATLVLPDPRIGPRHVEITRAADGFYARDLGWHEGTSCRGQRLGPAPFKLQSGDVLVLGQNVALLFEASP
ncbi:MAG: FAD-dependent oxidoreductase [Labilithrix sp.]|nr:FAD-dependent oxidoreductase [Labilithrix sp.]